MRDNLFERYDLDPREGPEAITARMREHMEEADDEEKERIRADWEALTLHPRDRLQIALEAFPETRAALAGPPPRPRLNGARPRSPYRDGPGGGAGSRVARKGVSDGLSLEDLVVRPSVAAPLTAHSRSGRGTEVTPEPLPPFDDDPILFDA